MASVKYGNCFEYNEIYTKNSIWWAQTLPVKFYIYIAEQVQTCRKWLPHIYGLCGTIVNEQDLANQEIYQL